MSYGPDLDQPQPPLLAGLSTGSKWSRIGDGFTLLYRDSGFLDREKNSSKQRWLCNHLWVPIPGDGEYEVPGFGARTRLVDQMIAWWRFRASREAVLRNSRSSNSGRNAGRRGGLASAAKRHASHP